MIIQFIFCLRDLVCACVNVLENIIDNCGSTCLSDMYYSTKTITSCAMCSYLFEDNETFRCCCFLCVYFPWTFATIAKYHEILKFNATKWLSFAILCLNVHIFGIFRNSSCKRRWVKYYQWAQTLNGSQLLFIIMYISIFILKIKYLMNRKYNWVVYS